MTDESRKGCFNIIIITAAFILTRLLFLTWAPYAYYDEEAKIGSIGHDLVFEHGLKLPFWCYLDSPHSGGSLFSGLAAIPFYLILGDRYLALKMTALFFSLLTVLLWFRLLAREIKADKLKVFYFLMLFSFATPHYVQKSVILAGNTVELMFFNILVILLFWKAIHDKRQAPANYLLLGIVCGFSLWVQFMSAYLILSLIIFMLLAEGVRSSICSIFLIFAGAIIGALPLWIYNIQYDWPTLTANAIRVSFVPNLSKLKSLLFIDLPASFHFLDMGVIKSRYLGYIVFIMFCVAFLVHIIFAQNKKNISKEERKYNLSLFLILYLSVFIIFTAFSTAPVRSGENYGWNSMNIHAEYYIISIQPVIFALFYLLNKYRKNFIKTPFNVALSIIFTFGFFSLFQTRAFNHRLFRPMHCTNSNAYECGFHFSVKPKMFLIFKEKMPEEYLEDYMKGHAERLHDTEF